eukprot:CAMPEP_0206374702 /NCGR_PEP_ID=MMETSP0294-20121207/8462_1 /ASSEMBLY_ACC=CAM_ASM_000327 /TAXON_ID=39354 /ORGANISM="Heterosigma akashiwo, Strain CCMP2393" /LENGTH=379 /DNA_ID=CAMNT_0053822523 /DNA_START=82 /DNA_END=1222 /DNA_ORIENTATION=+
MPEVPPHGHAPGRRAPPAPAPARARARARGGGRGVLLGHHAEELAHGVKGRGDLVRRLHRRPEEDGRGLEGQRGPVRVVRAHELQPLAGAAVRAHQLLPVLGEHHLVVGGGEEERGAAALGRGPRGHQVLDVEAGPLLHGQAQELQEPLHHEPRDAHPRALHQVQRHLLQAGEGRVQHQGGDGRRLQRRVQQRRGRAHAAAPQAHLGRPPPLDDVLRDVVDVVLLVVAQRDVLAVRQPAARKVEGHQAVPHRGHGVEHAAAQHVHAAAGVPVQVEHAHVVAPAREGRRPAGGHQQLPAPVHHLEVSPQHGEPVPQGERLRPQVLRAVGRARGPDDGVHQQLVAAGQRVAGAAAAGRLRAGPVAPGAGAAGPAGMARPRV